MRSYIPRQIYTSQLIWIWIFLDISGHNFLDDRGLFVAHPDDIMIFFFQKRLLLNQAAFRQ